MKTSEIVQALFPC